MKKSILKVFLFVSVFLSGVCAFSAKAKASVSTSVISIDKHGNLNLGVLGSSLYAKGFGVSDIVTIKIGKTSFDAPIVKNYSDVDKGSYLVRINGDEVSVAINMGSLYSATNANVGTSVSIKLKESRGYLLVYQKRTLKSSDNREDFPSDEVFANFREVRVGKIAAKRLYRSASPVNKESRAPYAAKLLRKAAPNVIINLADHKSEAHNITDEYYSKLIQEGKVVFVNMSASLTDKSVAESLREAMIAIAEHEGPYLIHGKEGKMRTGFVISILESLCGASIAEQNDDYMLSYENYNNIKKDSSQYEMLVQVMPEIFMKLDGTIVSNDNLQEVAENYLVSKVGLTRAQVKQIEKNLQ